MTNNYINNNNNSSLTNNNLNEKPGSKKEYQKYKKDHKIIKQKPSNNHNRDAGNKGQFKS